MDPGGKRIRDIGWLDVFFLLWEKWSTLLFLLLLFSHTSHTLSTFCLVHCPSSFFSFFLLSIHLSASLVHGMPVLISFSSRQPVFATALPLLSGYFALPIICGSFLQVHHCLMRVPPFQNICFNEKKWKNAARMKVNGQEWQHDFEAVFMWNGDAPLAEHLSGQRGFGFMRTKRPIILSKNIG